jgi:hypothetical protein
LATEVRELWVDENMTFDPNYGRSIVYPYDPYPAIGLLAPSKVIFRLDNSKFYALYVDLLTRPVPVTFDRKDDAELTADTEPSWR